MGIGTTVLKSKEPRTATPAQIEANIAASKAKREEVRKKEDAHRLTMRAAVKAAIKQGFYVQHEEMMGGHSTIAYKAQERNGQVIVFYGYALCSPKDSFCKLKGAFLAVSRATSAKVEGELLELPGFITKLPKDKQHRVIMLSVKGLIMGEAGSIKNVSWLQPRNVRKHKKNSMLDFLRTTASGMRP